MSLVEERDLNYNPLRTVSCRNSECKWKGQLKDCKCKYVNTSQESWQMLAGREGWEYSCPLCGWLVETNYIRMS